MSDKIKRLAKNISETLPNADTPQQVYDLLTEVMIRQKDYFVYLGPTNIIKLVFYIWSYKETKDFKLGDEILDKIAFANLITTEGNQYTPPCDYCAEEGEVTCEDCGGSGEVECHRCNGEGEVNCPECEGDGIVIGDEGEEECDTCRGQGGVECDWCDGSGLETCGECQNGKIECPECHGETIIETEELIYSNYFIVTWDKFIKDRCEITEDDTDITMSEYDFDRLRDNYIVLDLEDDLHEEFAGFIEENEMYCLHYDDNPRLLLGATDMRIKTFNRSMSNFRA